jgi:Tfp pilus assembly protein PilO
MNESRTWLRLWYLWVPPAVLVALNVVWLTGVRAVFLGRGSALAREVAATKSEVARLESQARQLQHVEQALANLRENLATLRKEQMAPMRDRLIPFLNDVIKRAEASGLRPDRITYSVQREKKSGLVYFSAHFDVKGSYEQIRRYVFELETSPQFILLEGLTLRGADSATSLDVGVQFGVGTYFADLDEGLLKQLGVHEVSDGE